MARRGRDPITAAVGKISQALQPLSAEQRSTVLAAVSAAFNPPAPRKSRAKKPTEPQP